QQLGDEAGPKQVNRNLVARVVGVALRRLFHPAGRDRDRSVPVPNPRPTPPASQQETPPPPPPAEPAEPVNEPVPHLAPSQPEVERNFTGALPLEGVAPDNRKKLVVDIEAGERGWVKVQIDRTALQEAPLYP